VFNIFIEKINKNFIKRSEKERNTSCQHFIKKLPTT